MTDLDLEQFNRAVLGLYVPELNGASFAENAIRFVASLVPADMICLSALDAKSKRLEVTFSRDDATLPEALAGFSRTMQRHRLFSFDPTINRGRPFFRGDFCSRRQFMNLDVFRESFGLMGWTDHAAVHLPTTDGRIHFISLERSGRVEYSERDRKILLLAQAQLINARKLADSRSRIRTSQPVNPECFVQAGFSPREADVLVWLVEGKSNAEIATLLRVRIQTVKYHLTSIFNKIGTGSRLAATLHALDIFHSAAACALPRKSVPLP